MAHPPPSTAPDTPLTQGPLVPTILRLSWPMMLGNLLQTSFSIIDMAFIGRLGPQALAGVALAGAIVHMVMTLVIGVDFGMRALVSRHYGARQLDTARRVAGQSLLLGGALTLILATAGLLWHRSLLELLGAAPQVADQGSAYLTVFFTGIITMVYMFFVSGMLQSIGDAATPMRISAWAFALNVPLDYVLIFGLGPIPALGVSGAALATILARGLAGLLLLRALFHHPSFRLGWGDLRLDWTLMRRIVRIAIPSSAQIGSYSISDILATRFIAGAGTAALAAYGLGSRAVMVVMILGFGLGGSAATMVGQNLGAGRPERAARSTWLIAAAFAGLLVLVGLLYYEGATAIVGVFTQDGPTAALGARYLQIYAMSFVFLAANLIFGRALQGAGDTFSPMVITAIVRLPVLMNLLHFLPQWGFNTDGLWYAFALAQVFEGLLKMFWFWRGKWKVKEI